MRTPPKNGGKFGRIQNCKQYLIAPLVQPVVLVMYEHGPVIGIENIKL